MLDGAGDTFIVAGHIIVIQGDANERTIGLMRGELAQAMKARSDKLHCNIGTIAARSNSRYHPAA